MTGTFTLYGRLLDDSKQPVKQREISLSTYPAVSSDATADEVHLARPRMRTNDNGELCRIQADGTLTTPGVVLLAGPGRQYTIHASSLLPRQRFDAPASGTLNIADIVTVAPAPEPTWLTTAQGLIDAAIAGVNTSIGSLTTALGTKVNSSTYTSGQNTQDTAVDAIRNLTDGAHNTALSAAFVAGRACTTTGVAGLPAPTGVGMEFVISAAGLDDIRFNGTSL